MESCRLHERSRQTALAAQLRERFLSVQQLLRHLRENAPPARVQACLAAVQQALRDDRTVALQQHGAAAALTEEEAVQRPLDDTAWVQVCLKCCSCERAHSLSVCVLRLSTCSTDYDDHIEIPTASGSC